MDNRLLVIGLDGATPGILFPLAEKGELPNLARLISSGVSGKLRSTIPPVTAPAWTSFMTGKNPGKLGIFDFVQRIYESYDTTTVDKLQVLDGVGVDISVISSKMIGTKKIWNYLNEADKKTGLLHVPITFPPEHVKGFVVSGLGTPGMENEFAYPSKLRKVLIDDYKYKIHITEIFPEGQENKTLRNVYETELKRAEVAIELYKNNELDFFMVVFEGIDFLQHNFWKYHDPSYPLDNPKKKRKYRNAIVDYYKKIDEFVGRILKHVDDKTTVVIMSDHGGGPLLQRFQINKWLEDIGVLKMKREIKREGRGFLVKHGLSKERIFHLLLRLGVARIIRKIPVRVRKVIPSSKFSISEIDWSETKAYSVGGWGFIYMNVKGREPSGVVEQGKEYEDLRNEIIEKLYELNEKTGKRYIQKVFRREEVYSGEYFEHAPDIVMLMNGADCDPEIDYLNEDRSYFVPATDKSGTHTPDGVFIINGQMIKKGKKLDAEIIDIAPTILYSMGVPVPNDMDGKVLKDSFLESYIKSNPVKYR